VRVEGEREGERERGRGRGRMYGWALLSLDAYCGFVRCLG
jgi:hypothetical protein